MTECAETMRQGDPAAQDGAGTDSGVASRLDRQRLWTAIMLDAGAKTPDRLKASELLGKSEGDFLDRVRHSAGASMDSLFSGDPEAAAAEGGA